MTGERRLIDANALGRDAFHIKQLGKGIRCVVDWDDIEAAPTVDAIEVVHGYWNISKEGYDECSVCGTACGIAEYDKFCSSCGEKMDGGADDGV